MYIRNFYKATLTNTTKQYGAYCILNDITPIERLVKPFHYNAII